MHNAFRFSTLMFRPILLPRHVIASVNFWRLAALTSSKITSSAKSISLSSNILTVQWVFQDVQYTPLWQTASARWSALQICPVHHCSVSLDILGWRQDLQTLMDTCRQPDRWSPLLPAAFTIQGWLAIGLRRGMCPMYSTARVVASAKWP